jgi:nucleoside-diphosphate-sugar epimerase
LIIGGTRFFGRTLVRRLVEAGNKVTILTRGVTADPFGAAVRRIRADRRDPNALASALSGERFDLVYDQMCYNPVDARAIGAILNGRVGHYIMSSTIEVYEHLRGVVAGDYRESDIDLSRLGVDFSQWGGEADDALYGAGKRQAEAVVASGPLEWTIVRIAHVLSGPDDFTGRLADYVGRAIAKGTLHHSPAPGPSSFLTVDMIVDFLLWLGESRHGGVFNAAADEALSAIDLQRIVCAAIGNDVAMVPAAAGAALTPFDFPARHSMDTRRARSLGFEFGTIRERIPDLVRAHLAAAAP